MLTDVFSGLSPVPLEVDVAVVVPVVVLPVVDAVAVVVVVVEGVDDDDASSGGMLVRSGQSIFKSIGTPFLNPKIMDNFLIVTTCKRSLGQGNIFTPVCQSFCS